jgi:hypothetical protein
MAVVIGVQGRPTPIIEDFSIADSERAAVNAAVEQISAALDASGLDRRILILAALAELSAKYMGDSELERHEVAVPQ